MNVYIIELNQWAAGKDFLSYAFLLTLNKSLISQIKMTVMAAMQFSYGILILDALKGIIKVTAKQQAVLPNMLLVIMFPSGENKGRNKKSSEIHKKEIK